MLSVCNTVKLYSCVTFAVQEQVRTVSTTSPAFATTAFSPAILVSIGATVQSAE